MIRYHELGCALILFSRVKWLDIHLLTVLKTTQRSVTLECVSQQAFSDLLPPFTLRGIKGAVCVRCPFRVEGGAPSNTAPLQQNDSVFEVFSPSL